jgi:hypothetical protein
MINPGAMEVMARHPRLLASVQQVVVAAVVVAQY